MPFFKDVDNDTFLRLLTTYVPDTVDESKILRVFPSALTPLLAVKRFFKEVDYPWTPATTKTLEVLTAARRDSNLLLPTPFLPSTHVCRPVEQRASPT